MTASEIISLVSLVVTTVIGGLTLFWLKRYTEETIALRKIAEQQQESQASPVLVLNVAPSGLTSRYIQVKNISLYPAFNVQIDSIPILGAYPAIFTTVPYLGAGEECAIESPSNNPVPHQPFEGRAHAIALIEGLKPSSVVVRCRALTSRTHAFTWKLIPPIGMGTIRFEYEGCQIQ